MSTLPTPKLLTLFFLASSKASPTPLVRPTHISEIIFYLSNRKPTSLLDEWHSVFPEI
jgi:hypothetical protein